MTNYKIQLDLKNLQSKKNSRNNLSEKSPSSEEDLASPFASPLSSPLESPSDSPEILDSPKLVRSRSKSLILDNKPDIKLEPNIIPVKFKRRRSYSDSLDKNEQIISDNLSIKNILNNIKTNLKLDIDMAEYIQVLISELILNFDILCRLNPADLDSLKLPLIIRSELKKIINNNKNKLFDCYDLDQNTLELIKKSLNIIKTNIVNLVKLDEEFYKIYIELDPYAKKLFSSTNFFANSLKFGTYIKIIISFISDPIEFDLNLKTIARKYLIYGLDETNFENIAYSFTKSIAKIIISDADIKKYQIAWYITLKKIGQVIINKYPQIKRGSQYYLYFKEKKWKQALCKITPYKIKFMARGELIHQFLFTDILSVTKVDKLNNNSKKQNDFCLEIEPKSEQKYYFCANSILDYINIFQEIQNILQIYTDF